MSPGRLAAGRSAVVWGRRGAGRPGPGQPGLPRAEPRRGACASASLPSTRPEAGLARPGAWLRCGRRVPTAAAEPPTPRGRRTPVSLGHALSLRLRWAGSFSHEDTQDTRPPEPLPLAPLPVSTHTRARHGRGPAGPVCRTGQAAARARDPACRSGGPAPSSASPAAVGGSWPGPYALLAASRRLGCLPEAGGDAGVLWGPGAGRVGPGETGARARVSSALAHASRTAPHRQAPRCGSRASDQSDRGDTGGTVAVQGAQRSEAGGACGFWPRAGRGCQASHVSGARRVALAQQPWPHLGRLGRAGRAPPPAAAALRDLRWSPVAG